MVVPSGDMVTVIFKCLDCLNLFGRVGQDTGEGSIDLGPIEQDDPARCPRCGSDDTLPWEVMPRPTGE